MSQAGDAIARRLAEARATGDAAPLASSEALADALVLLREATPAPDGDIDFSALADVCWTLSLRVKSGRSAAEREVVTAPAILGFLHARAPGYISLPDLPSEMAGDPHCDARFAFVVAMAHMAFGASEDLPRHARLVSVEIALAWAEQCGAFGDDAAVTLLRMGLLALRSQLAPEPDDLADALAMARTLLGRLDADEPRHADAFRTLHEVLAMAAARLGDPAADEAERILGAAPADTITDRAARHLVLLRAVHAESEEWPGQAGLRAGAVMVDAGIKSSDVSLLAFGIRRLRAAVPAIPEGRALGDEAERLLAAALLVYGELCEDPAARIEGRALAMRLLDEFHATLTAYAAEKGVALPPEIELGAILLDVCASLASQKAAIGAVGELMARYHAAFPRLPADDPDYAAFAAIANAPDSGMVTMSMLAVPWARLAADVRAALPDGQLATIAADAFENMASAMPALTEEGSAHRALRGLKVRDQGDLDAGVARLRAELAKASDHKVSERLTVVLGTLLLLRSLKAHDRDAVEEAIGLLLRADPRKLPSGTRMLLGLARLRYPARVGDDVQRLREELAMLASLPRGEGTPVETASVTLAECMARGMLLVDDADVPQTDKITELTQGLRDLAGQAGPQLMSVVGPLLNVVDTVMQGAPARLEAVVGGQAAEADAAQVRLLREQIEALAVGDPARDVLAVQLVIALAGQARNESDPARARELLAEAEDLAAQAPIQQVPGAGEVIPVPVAEELLQAFLTQARAKVEGTAPPPHPLAKEQLGEWALAASGYSEAAVLGMLRDQRIPAHRRVTDGFGAAFHVLAEPPRADQAMTYAETVLEVLADVTDRGADQRSAELALSVYTRGFTPTFVSGVLGIEHWICGMEKITQALRGQGPQPGQGPDTAESPRVDRAAALLERGRGMLLARMMEGRADLGELHRVRPDLAREFGRLTAQLGAAPDALARLRPDAPSRFSGREEWARLTKLRISRDYDELITQIREQDGLTDFLLPPTAERMRELAAEGPVVMLVYPSLEISGDATEGLAPHAVVVTTDRITSLRIDAEPATVSETAARMRSALEVINARPPHRPGPDDVMTAGERFREALSWTWHTVVRPVLEVAGVGGPVEGAWPRIWWIPGGPFNALPLHAAECTLPECDLGGCGAALETIVSSYVPGFRALAHVRAAAAMRRETPRSRWLLVAASPVDLTAVTVDTVLAGADVTREAVLAAIRDATHVHFGCHAGSDPAEPSGGTLYLPSGQDLPVLEICRIQPRSARLAFLAACGTSQASQRLADESIHLSSAFLLAGFPDAVGTLWKIDSTDADRIAKAFYRSLLPPARALHQVIRQLRHDQPSRPHIWASYVHAGI